MAMPEVTVYGHRQRGIKADSIGYCEHAVLPSAGTGTESDWATTFTILKAIMGAGGFALPWAFSRTGLTGGVVAVVACAGLGTFTVRELVALKAHVESEQSKSDATYVDVAREAFGAVGGSVVYVLTLVCSLGVPSAYLVFIGTTLHSLLPTVSQQLLMLLTAAVVLPITWMKDFSLLSRLAEYGTYAVLAGYGVTLDYAIRVRHANQQPGHPSPASVHVGWDSMARGFGPVAFLFCVHFLLFPLLSASRAATRPGGFEAITARAFGLACCVNAAFAVLGLLAFHGEVSSIVVNDIPQGTWYIVATKLLLCLDLFCSYPLVLAAGRQVVEQSLFQEDEESAPICPVRPDAGLVLTFIFQNPNAKSRAVRTFLVLVTLLIAQVRDFGTIISLVGGFAQVLMAFVLPPLMSLKLLSQEMTVGRRALNLLVLPMGFAVAMLATVTTLVDVLGHGH